MEEEVKFNNLRIDGEIIIDWQYIEINNRTRIYYRLNEDDMSGFKFAAAETIIGEDFMPESVVEGIFYGDAIFEGVRHFFVSNEGYINYHDFKVLAEMFIKIDELCRKHCGSYD